ncbi:hypothetical protein RI367_008013 [Sorochytrium milnesiophthora]
MENDDQSPSPPPIELACSFSFCNTLDKHKLQAYSQGIQKKSAFQRAKEEAEERKRARCRRSDLFREEEEAALVYKDFVASFNQPANSFKTQQFVRGESSSSSAAAGDTASRLYQPQARQTIASFTEDEPAPDDKSTVASRRRKMNEYMETIKRKHEQAAPTSQTPALDRNASDEKTSTNLYIGNLHPKLDEETICHEFSRFGDIASVKVMWPRTPEDVARGHNSGFVSFMQRSAAEAAMNAMQGRDVLGFAMRMDWGKPVAIPAKPADVIKVVIPQDAERRAAIHATVERVLVHGPQFEIALIRSEHSNPKFDFLHDISSPDHHYYRWRLHSLHRGESVSHWSREARPLYVDGKVYEPPDQSEQVFEDEVDYEEQVPSSDDDLQDSQHGRRRVSMACQRFAALLRTLTLDRQAIARAMALAIDSTDAAEQIMQTLVRSLMVQGTPAHVKIARLNLLSDILYNSGASVPNAWKYRLLAEPHLLPLFTHLNQVFRAVDARLKAEMVRRAVVNVLKAWQGWLVYPPAAINELEAVFLSSTNAEPEIARQQVQVPVVAVPLPPPPPPPPPPPLPVTVQPKSAAATKKRKRAGDSAAPARKHQSAPAKPTEPDVAAPAQEQDKAEEEEEEVDLFA